MSYEVSGKLKVKMETQTFSSGFAKREFVVTTAEQYPQDIKLELVKDKCSLMDKFKVGQEVTVSFNLRGNFYEPKNAYYNSLQAWKIEALENGAMPLPQQNGASFADDGFEDAPF
jgi:single-strand DNA-binding protein